MSLTVWPDPQDETATPFGQRWIPAGSFTMGSDRHYPEEAPARRVEVEGFWIDAAPVTNRAFADFVARTDYVTIAERPLDPADYPGTSPEALVPGSLFFRPTDGPVDTRDMHQWWHWTRGACWHRPEGPGSSIEGREDHPVVQIALADAEAYAAWAGRALPTEAEWEFAARGGLEGAEFAWGGEFAPQGRQRANTWQGVFPCRNTEEDGFAGTSPVGAFPPTGFGLFDMIGNVWEWTADWWSAGPAPKTCCGAREDVRRRTSCDGISPIPRKVVKGGSFLCAPGYCRRYRPAARHAQPIDSGMSHIGFRCVRRPPPASALSMKGEQP
nr:formylglycine-generating enzyme family protein [uncultured Roseococcus sp.]